MSKILGLDHVGIKPDGATLSLSLAPGQSLGVCGPAGSGKSRFLRVVSGHEKPPQGTVRLRTEVFVPPALPRRSRVQAFAREYPDFVDLLNLTGLWDHRQAWLSDLTPSQAALAELLPALAQTHGIVVLDGRLDSIDAWTLPHIRDRMRSQARNGVSFLATTNRPDLIAGYDSIVVLRNQEVRFAGSLDDLLRFNVPHEILVETQKQRAVRALVEPFEVSVEETPEGLRIWAKDGQELAARLMLEGYGDVRLIMHRAPTVEEALRAVV